MKYDATIVIPTYNRAHLLDHTLYALTKINNTKHTFEIIVVDDGSTDNTKDIVSRYKCLLDLKYFFQIDCGFRVAKARNIGIENAQGDIIIFLDCGILFSSYSIERHIRNHIEEKNDVAVIGYVVGYDDFNENKEKIIELIDVDNIDESVDKMIANNLFDMREVLYKELGDNLSLWPAPWCICWTGNFSVSKKILQKYGGFDETFTSWGGEDTELGIKLYLKGVQLKLDRKAVGIHYPHEKEKVIISKSEMKQRTIDKRRYMYEKYKLESIKKWIHIETFDLNKNLLSIENTENVII